MSFYYAHMYLHPSSLLSLFSCPLLTLFFLDDPFPTSFVFLSLYVLPLIIPALFAPFPLSRCLPL